MEKEWDSVYGQRWEEAEGYENLCPSPVVPEISNTMVPITPWVRGGSGVKEIRQLSKTLEDALTILAS